MTESELERRRRHALSLGADVDPVLVLAAWRGVAELEPSSVEAWARVATLADRLGEVELAVEAHSMLAAHYVADGLVLRAIAACKSVLALAPERGEARRELVQLLAHRRPTSGPSAPAERGRKQSFPHMTAQSLIRADSDAGPPAPAPTLPPTPLFSELPEEAFISIVEGLSHVSPPDGAEVVREGEIGHSFFVIARGHVRVEKASAEGPLLVARLSEGDFFGEMALLVDEPRTASVRVEGDGCELLEIPRALLDELVFQYPSVERILRDFYRDRLLTATLATHPLFAPFGPAERRHLMGEFEGRSVGPDQVLVEQGRPGEALFVLLSGAVEVDVDGTRVLARLGPGEVFGEMSLLSGHPTGARVRTLRSAYVLRLARERFRALAEQAPEVLRRLEALEAQRRAEGHVALTGPSGLV